MATRANLAADIRSSRGTKNGWMAEAVGPGVLAVGDLVQPHLERGEDEEHQPHLGIHRCPGVRVFLVFGGRSVGFHSAPHLMR